MAVYRLADLTVQVDGASEYTGRAMSRYQADAAAAGKPDIFVSVTPEVVERERRLEGDEFSREYLECMSVYREFCEQALFYDVLFFHASAVALDGNAYLFTGPSGIGKSTHARMWRKAFGKSVLMINDDKPLLRFRPDGVYAYGTPWDGKHHLNTDIRLKVKGVCILEQASWNEIRRVSFPESHDMILSQAFHTENWDHRQAVKKMINLLLNRVPVYRLKCTASTQAACLARQVMEQGDGRAWK